MRIRSWIMGMVLAGVVVSMAGAAGLEKRLILHSWDMKGPAYLAENAGRLQHAPFDGLVVRARGTLDGWDDTSRATNFCYTFYNKNVDVSAAEPLVEAMSKIKWGKFTDNFMYMVPGDNVDWFDEAAWDEKDGYILKNVRAIARMGQAGGCKGILFNPEFVYWGAGGEPWNYGTQASRDEKSVAEYRAMVRKRGAQFINAIEEYMPDTTFLTLYWGVYYSPVAKIAKATDPKMVDKIVEEAESYGLLNDFMVGILEGADKGTTIVDGNEYAYYRWDEAGYNTDYHFVHQTMLGAIPEELRYKYRAQVRMGHAIYADVQHSTREMAYLPTFMTPEERALHMEWVVYHALKNSDGYAWVHAEKPQYLDNVRVPPEMAAAIDRARRKVARNEEIGFDITPIRDRAAVTYNRVVRAALKPSKAEIVRAASRPKVDGKLNDETWKKASKLGPFKNILRASNPHETRTTAYVAYDDRRLYIAVRVEDPAREKDLDRSVWIGIAADEEASKYYEIRLTDDNERWDSLTPASASPNEIDGKDESWNGEYETGTHVAEDFAFWSAEAAIPWASMNRSAPKSGEQIKANILQNNGRRASHGSNERTSWSQMRLNRLMIEDAARKSLGTWEFK